MSGDHNWLLSESGHVATLILNRPEHANSLTTDCLLELRDISRRLDSNEAIDVVILEGSGNHFSSGMDPGEFRADLELPIDELQAGIHEHQECLRVFESIGKATIAKIRGFCLGGGLVLALCCDFRIASQRAIFSFPEIKIGLPFLWGSYRITRIAGVARAKELILLGGRHRAKQLEEWNVLHKVVPEEKLDGAVSNFVRKLEVIPPHSYWVCKEIIQASLELPPLESEEVEIEALRRLSEDMDLKAAVETYLDVRSLG